MIIYGSGYAKLGKSKKTKIATYQYGLATAVVTVFRGLTNKACRKLSRPCIFFIRKKKFT